MASALLIERESGFRNQLRRYLESRGIETHTAADLDEAGSLLPVLDIDLLIMALEVDGEAGRRNFAYAARETRPDLALIGIMDGENANTFQESGTEYVLGFIGRSLETTAIENCIRHFHARQEMLRRIRWLERKLARTPRLLGLFLRSARFEGPSGKRTPFSSSWKIKPTILRPLRVGTTWPSSPMRHPAQRVS